jgi:hypothetical protein
MDDHNMAHDHSDVFVVVVGARDDDQEDIADLTYRLRVDLLDLDVESVEPVPGEAVPAGAKGLPPGAALLGVRLAGVALKHVLKRVREWAGRSGRSVEVTIDGDTVKITGATDEQQQKIVDAWLSRHAATG